MNDVIFLVNVTDFKDTDVGVLLKFSENVKNNYFVELSNFSCSFTSPEIVFEISESYPVDLNSFIMNYTRYLY